MAAACSWPEAAEVAAAAEVAEAAEAAEAAELAPAAELAAAAAWWLARAARVARVAAYPGDGAAGAKSHDLTAALGVIGPVGHSVTRDQFT